MTAGGWDWVEPIRRELFGAPLLGRYRLEETDEDGYWELHERELRSHFPPEVFFDFDRLRPPEQRERRARLIASQGAQPLAEHWIVRDGDALAAMFCGNQWMGSTWEMFHTTVHRDHRRKGLYAAIVQLQLAYSKALGFDMVVSEHAPGNNPVLLAKLGAGFRVLGLEINPALGPGLRLCYFHNPEHLAAYEYQMGNATLTPAMAEAGRGAFDQLRRQFRGEA